MNYARNLRFGHAQSCGLECLHIGVTVTQSKVSADSIRPGEGPCPMCGRPLKFRGAHAQGDRQSYRNGRTGDKRRFHTCWARAIEKLLLVIRQQDAREEETSN